MSEQSGGNSIVELPSQVTIRQISDIHEIVFSNLKTTTDAVFSLPDNAEIDLTFAQLMVSARKYADSNGKTVRMAGPAKGHLLAVLTDAGFLSDPAETAFWLHKEAPR